ncbi:hypothetical protein [Acidovorax sp. Root219]|uniref:hypothetical protein n=1 Tax=Acidovorax sp. Root219 TaxID=1736493 RepID=UPI000B2F532E|nr:hypothetical protein [Acidovorax sp. Root219]
MRWIVVAICCCLVPPIAFAAMSTPPGTVGLAGALNLAYLLALSSGVGWLVQQVAQTSGRFNPKTEAVLSAASALIVGPLLWFALFR